MPRIVPPFRLDHLQLRRDQAQLELTLAGRELQGNLAALYAEAQAALVALKQMDANLEYSASVFRRNWPDPADVDHLLDGLRKAGFE